MPKTIDHLTFDDTIRKPWAIRHPSCDGSGQCNQGRCPFGGHCPVDMGAIDTEPGDLEDAKRETESAALFVAGLVIVCICACLGLWLSFVVGG